MKPSTCHSSGPEHVAIIMDGNGRWAAARGWPRTAGHRAGAGAIQRTVEAAARFGVRTLTLYAFSCDNWKRPAAEVSTLLSLFRKYLNEESERCMKEGIRVSVIGRRDRLSLALCAAIEKTENATATGKNFHLRLAVDYSGRDEILSAARRMRRAGESTREEFERLLVGADPAAARVDLLIRTGGEQRLSDFLLWECAYAELYFTPVMWPDFFASELEAAIDSYHHRDRRFGGVPVTSAAS